MYVKRTLMATDKNGEDVLIAKGDQITEIEDAGPILSTAVPYYKAGYDDLHYVQEPIGWNVTCRFTPQHKLWTEIITVSAIELLKALEAEDEGRS